MEKVSKAARFSYSGAWHVTLFFLYLDRLAFDKGSSNSSYYKKAANVPPCE